MLRKCAYVGVKWFIIKIDSISSFFASAVPRNTTLVPAGQRGQLTSLDSNYYRAAVNTTGAPLTNPRCFEVAKTHMNGTYKVLTSISVVLPVTSTADVTVSSFCMNFHMLLRPDSSWGTHRPTHSQLFGVCHLDIPRGVSGAKNRMSVVVLPVSECHSLAPRCAS